MAAGQEETGSCLRLLGSGDLGPSEPCSPGGEEDGRAFSQSVSDLEPSEEEAGDLGLELVTCEGAEDDVITLIDVREEPAVIEDPDEVETAPPGAPELPPSSEYRLQLSPGEGGLLPVPEHGLLLPSLGTVEVGEGGPVLDLPLGDMSSAASETVRGGGHQNM